jgi:hypothetical protein
MDSCQTAPELTKTPPEGGALVATRPQMRLLAPCPSGDRKHRDPF